jgi:hypothetical protein
MMQTGKGGRRRGAGALRLYTYRLTGKAKCSCTTTRSKVNAPMPCPRESNSKKVLQNDELRTIIEDSCSGLLYQDFGDWRK